MPEKVLGTIRVILCRLNRINKASDHLFTQEAWKNIWRDFPFCVEFAERRLYCYRCSPDLTDEIVGIITKIDIGKKAVRANIDLIDTEGGRCLYEKSKESSLVNNFYVCGEGKVERENEYYKVVPERFKLRDIHFQEEPLVWVKPAPLVDSGVTVTETNVSSMTPLTERSAPAGLNRGVLDIIGRGTEENAVEHTITGERVTPIEHVAIRMEETGWQVV
jgi:hypothetical protein